MWKQDLSNYSEEERRLNEKINKINKDNADFLKRQMEDKSMGKAAKMNKQEWLLNKELLKEINDKKKNSQYAESQCQDQWLASIIQFYIFKSSYSVIIFE